MNHRIFDRPPQQESSSSATLTNFKSSVSLAFIFIPRHYDYNSSIARQSLALAAILQMGYQH
jgi:hypothetical protein